MLFGRHKWMQRAAIRACSKLAKNSKTMRRLLTLAEKKGDEYVSAKAAKVLKEFEKPVKTPADAIGEPSLMQISVASIEVEPSVIAGAVSSEDRMEVLQNIVDSKDRTKLADIVNWLKESGGDKKVQASYLMALGRLGGTPEVKAIAPFLTSGDDRVRANTVEALGMIYERYGISEIPEMVKSSLSDRHNRVRANAIVAMEGKNEAEEALEQMVYSGSPTYQRSAIYAISVLGQVRYKPFLEFLSRAKEKMVQKQATEVLDFLTDSEAVPKLNSVKELHIGDGTDINDQQSFDGDELGDLSCSVINPWDSALLSEEQAAALFRQGQKLSTRAGKNAGVKKSAKGIQVEEGTVAQGIFEAISSTFVLVTGALFYGLALILVCGLLYYIFVILTEYFPDPLWSIVGCFMAVLLMATIEGLTPRPVDGNTSGVRVNRREAVKLYAIVDKIADQLRVRKPASILIHPYSEIGLYDVTATPFIPLTSEPQIRIGLASMRALSISQLRALIYAELARVEQSNKQTYLKLVRSIDSTVQQIHEKLKVDGDARVYVNPLFYGAMLYRALVRAISSSTTMRIILDSDRRAAHYAGKEVYKAALNKYSISARLFDHDLQEIILGASTQSSDQGKENIYSYYRDFLDGLSEKRLVKLKTEIFKCPPPGNRTFPPLQKRLDAASSVPDSKDDDGTDLTQAVSLLENVEKLEDNFSALFMTKLPHKDELIDDEK